MNLLDSTLIQQGYSPSAVHEVPATDLPEGVQELTYIGYFKHGNPNEAIIQRVQKTVNETTFMFPYGQFLFNFDWDERTAYPYEYRKQ
jgi:hypothetical protein